MALVNPLLSAASQTARLADLKARNGAPPWSERLMMNDEQQAFLIHQPPGHPNDTHYHEHDEWWVILEGEFAWYFEDDPEPHHVRAGDFVFGPAFRWHHIEVLGTEPATRLAIGHRGEFHRYDRPGCGPAGAPETFRPT
jgi:mannose-6-phosphate isomerase-like protein (cupin superfamily)